MKKVKKLEESFLSKLVSDEEINKVIKAVENHIDKDSEKTNKRYTKEM